MLTYLHPCVCGHLSDAHDGRCEGRDPNGMRTDCEGEAPDGARCECLWFEADPTYDPDAPVEDACPS